MAQTTRRRRPYAARVPIEQRREQLLDAALAIIDRDGYDRVSVDAIARESGVTRPVVYGAFDGLGALLLAHAVVAVLEHLGRLILDDPERWPAERLVEALVPLLPR